MVLAISQRRRAQHPFEVANEAAVIVKPAVQRHIGNGGLARAQVLAGDQDPQSDNILPRARPKGLHKAALQLALGKAELFGNLGDVQALGVVRADVFHHFKNRQLGVIVHALVALHDTAQPDHTAFAVEQRHLVGDAPLR